MMWARHRTASIAPLVLFLCILAHPAHADEISTTGNCGNVFKDIKGNITVNCGADASGRPLFRVTYYRLSGLASSMLVRGMLPPDLERILGGQSPIVDNSVLQTVQSFLKRFSTELRLYGIQWSPNHDKGPHRYGAYEKSHTFQFYPILGGSFDNGSLPSISYKDPLFTNKVLRSTEWPLQYNLYYDESAVSDNNIVAPQIWRELAKQDMTKEFMHNIEIFNIDERSFSATDSSDHNEVVWQRILVDSFRYLNNMPSGFLVAYSQSYFSEGEYGECDTPGASISWNIIPRTLEAIIGVIENVSQQSVDIGDFKIRLAGDQFLRTEGDSDLMLDRTNAAKERLFPIGVLRAGEKLIIPLRMQFAVPRGWDEVPKNAVVHGQFALNEKKRRENNATMKIHWFPKKFPIRIPAHDPDNVKMPHSVTKKSAQLPLPTAPVIPDRFDFGPAIRLESVQIGGKEYAIRQYDPNRFMLSGELGIGSCPYLFVFDYVTRSWKKIGKILTDSPSKHKEAEYIKTIEHFPGRLQIRELEDEVTYINVVEGLLSASDGQEVQLVAQNESVKQADAKFLRLERGDVLDIALADPKRYGGHGKTFRLKVQGYFERVRSYAADKRSRVPKTIHLTLVANE